MTSSFGFVCETVIRICSHYRLSIDVRGLTCRLADTRPNRFACFPLIGLERPEAHIVNVSSMGGFVPVPGQKMYCAAKAAVKMMSEGLASELMGTRVQVSVVFPGAVATKIRENSGLSPQPSAGSQGTKALPPKEAAAIIVRGIERNMHRIFVGKDASIMDKLYRLNPDSAARAIAKKLRVLAS